MGKRGRLCGGSLPPTRLFPPIAPYGPHGAMGKIRRYPLCGDTPQRPVGRKNDMFLIQYNRFLNENSTGK